MNILFVSDTDRPSDWIPALQDALPEARFRVWPDTGPAAAIEYAVVWKPEPGLLASLPNLRGILSLGAGVDALLADDTLPAGVPLVRMVDDGLTAGMTEYVCWQVLAAHRNAAVYRGFQAERRWRPMDERLARERTVAVLGLGVLGADAARMLARLGFAVRGWARRPREIEGVATVHGDAGLDAVLDGAEILVCLLPLTPATRGILNAGLFARLPRGAYLINAARGGHLVADDLLAALDDGRLSGAALDVFEPEPLPADHPFWSHPGITVTPHVASVTHARTAAAGMAAEIRRMERGEPPAHPVDRARGY